MAELTLYIPGRIPSKKNSKRIVRRGNRSLLIGSADYLSWKGSVALLLNSRAKETIQQANSITLKFKFPDNRRADLTNKAESIMDAIVDAGILKDDRWQVTSTITLIPLGVDKENPGVEVIIDYEHPEVIIPQ